MKRFHKWYDTLEEPIRMLLALFLMIPTLVIAASENYSIVIRILALIWTLFMGISRYMYINGISFIFFLKK